MAFYWHGDDDPDDLVESFSGLSLGGLDHLLFFGSLGTSSSLRTSNTQQLYEKANTYASLYCHMTTMPWMCRDISESYYIEMHHLSSHAGMMMPTLKDQGGHRNNPINSAMRGLFFMARDDINDVSYFGPKRLAVPSYNLLAGCNFYFTDFYCLKSGGVHYLQIVATKPYSPEDMFCVRKKLPKLEKNNEFLSVCDVSETVRCADRSGLHRKLYVEVFYASSLDTNTYISDKGAKFLTVTCKGKTTKGGKPRCPTCPECA